MKLKASVLIVDDDETLRLALADRFAFWGHDVVTAPDGLQAVTLAAERAFDLILMDLTMPGIDGLETMKRLAESECSADIVVLTAHGSVQKAVEALKLGAADFLTKPADFDLLENVVERSLERRRLRRVSQAFADRTESRLVGSAPVMLKLVETANRAARADTTVILSGESGTGKQVLAEHIHAQSLRATGPFVYVNYVAISDELIESTLFGHERGAFTGAVGRKSGRLEAAGGGTAFLDEIGDVSPNLQTKLLHFLETGEFERVGGNQTVRVDCRIIAATNRDLEHEVKEGRFREDLFYRLNVINLRVPPLRERDDDIPVLAECFLAEFSDELKRERLHFAARTLAIMHDYSWPGNVRQLRNAVERMAVLAPTDTLTADLLPPEVLAGPAADADDIRALPYKEAVTVFKRRIVRQALVDAGGNQTRAAAELGLQRSYLNRLIKELDAQPEKE